MTMPITVYDSDYYAQGEARHRLHPLFSPILALLYGWRARATLARLRFSKPGRVLDVGAGRGEFLFYLKRKGWQIEGTQISEAAISAAKKRYGILLKPLCLPSAKELGAFDLVTYWHTFEHLTNAREHVAQLRDLLRNEDSVVVIEVPNPQSLGAHICFRSWLGGDQRHHVNMLSYQSIDDLLCGEGLKVFRCERFSLKFSFIYMYSALCGRFLGRSFEFDFFMNFLKRPVETLLSRKVLAFRWIAASFVFVPLCFVLVPYGIVTNQSETLRIYAKPSRDAAHQFLCPGSAASDGPTRMP